MGINLGAFFLASWFVGLWILNGDSLAACVGMIVSLVSFVLFQKQYLISEEGKEIGLPVQKLDFKSIGLIIGSIAIIFFMLNFKQMFKSDIEIISYLIYGAMLAMPIIILSDKSLT
jgi:POT family proton-dependent oligopeptide transporter